MDKSSSDYDMITIANKVQVHAATAAVNTTPYRPANHLAMLSLMPRLITSKLVVTHSFTGAALWPAVRVKPVTSMTIITRRFKLRRTGVVVHMGVIMELRGVVSVNIWPSVNVCKMVGSKVIRLRPCIKRRIGPKIRVTIPGCALSCESFRRIVYTR